MERAFYVGTGGDVPAGYGRVYYGEEACERLLPSAAEAVGRVKAFRRDGLAVTLVFPPVSDTGLARAREILRALRREKGLESVVNDYGLLSAARKAAPGMRTVVGRILSRVLARNLHDLAAYSLGEHRRFCAELRGFGVCRFDFDAFTLERAFPETLPFPMSLMTPYALISFTRRCALARVGNPDERPFGSCRKQCLETAFTVRNTALHGVFELAGNKILRRMDEPASLPRTLDRRVDWDPLAALKRGK